MNKKKKKRLKRYITHQSIFNFISQGKLKVKKCKLNRKKLKKNGEIFYEKFISFILIKKKKNYK